MTTNSYCPSTLICSFIHFLGTQINIQLAQKTKRSIMYDQYQYNLGKWWDKKPTLQDCNVSLIINNIFKIRYQVFWNTLTSVHSKGEKIEKPFFLHSLLFGMWKHWLSKKINFPFEFPCRKTFRMSCCLQHYTQSSNPEMTEISTKTPKDICKSFLHLFLFLI